MEKVMFILHMYSVGGAERRCVSIANYLASHGVEVKIVLLDINKMYACKQNHDCSKDHPHAGISDSDVIIELLRGRNPFHTLFSE